MNWGISSLAPALLAIFCLAIAGIACLIVWRVARTEGKARKRSAAELCKAESDWARTFDAISDGVLIIDKDHFIVRCNKAAAALFKAGPEGLIGKKCHAVIHRMDKPWPKCPLEMSRADNKPHMGEIYSPACNVPILVSASPLFDDKGKYAGVVYVAKDISRQKKTMEDLIEAKEKLREEMRVKSDFTSVVSHELRTPLTAIKEGISVVLNKTAGPVTDEQKELLEIAKGNVDRLCRLINDILDFQRLELGKMIFCMEEYDINGVVKEVCRLMEPAVKHKRLDIVVETQDNLPSVKFDRDKIIQVVTNLVNNAVKFTVSGSIVIGTCRRDNGIEVSVKDTGAGIKKEDLPKLFRQFSQLQTGSERSTGGSGLGLAICRQIIEAHKGKIWAESDVGKGATFCFFLPVK